jgi:hypothetical protein
MKKYAFAALLMLAACKNENLPMPQGRFEVKKVSGDTVQFIPLKDQLPYCLIFTRSQNGTLRQMTMSNENRSVHCPVGEPVMGLTFKIPATEGDVKVLGVFSDQKLNAAAIAQQLYENPEAGPMDLRAPGKVNAVMVTFKPSSEGAAQGAVVGAGGELGDAGTSQPMTPGAKVIAADGGLEKPNP